MDTQTAIGSATLGQTAGVAAMDRRSFVTGAAAVAGAAMAGVALTGSAPAVARADGQTWDVEADVVVVGTGTAAMAAVAALDYGAQSVVVLEKLGIFGGTTAMSGQGLGIPLSDAAAEAGFEDREEKVLSYYRNATNGRWDEAVSRSYIANGNEFLRWTRGALGTTWGFTSPAFQDYYEPLEGFLPQGRGSLFAVSVDGYAEGEAPRLWALVEQKLAADERCTVMLNTPATGLVVENGAVVGVEATDPSGATLRIRADKGVVLGTGGFDYNDALRKDCLPFPLFVTNACSGNTGDGHLMGMKIGAATAYMDCVWGLPCFLPAGEDVDAMIDENRIASTFVGNDWAMWRGKPGAVVVNRSGRRFGDEAQVYGNFNLDFGQFSSGMGGYPNIPAFFICDSAFAAVYTLPGQAAVGDPVPDNFVVADTLAELAEKLGIDPAGLEEEIAQFNEDARTGVDPKFGRGAKSIDVNTTGLFAGMRTDIANPCLAPVEVGPFYGAVYVPGTCGTCGGLKTDANAQVVDLSGAPIAGLYAVGNCSFGVSGGKYLHGGMTVGSGCVMGWVAVRHMLGVA